MIKLQASSRPLPEQVRPLRAMLAERGRGAPNEDAVAEARAQIEQRRQLGAQFLSDLTQAELDEIRGIPQE